MKAVHKVIKPTAAVRRLMRAHGASSWAVFTNKYEKCRTVKCYAGQIASVELLRADIKALFSELGYGEPQCHFTESYSDFRNTRAFIVRIPFDLQAA